MTTRMEATLQAVNTTPEGKLFRLDFLLSTGGRLVVERPDGFDLDGDLRLGDVTIVYESTPWG